MTTATEMGSTKITPEVLQEMLQHYNLTRQEFIESYNIQPLVYVPELPLGAKTTFVIMYAVIFVLALVGNSLVVYIVNISSEWLGGVLICKTIPFVQTMAIVTGILTMTCIAVERYQGIVYPLKMRRQYTPKRAYKMLGLVWSASVVVGSPMLFVQQLEVKYDFLYDHHHVCCQERWRSLVHRQVYTTFIMVALFLMPMAAMLFLYTRIGIELWIRKRVGDSSVLNTMNHREVNKISRKKKRAVKMMITIVLLFTICWAPFHTVHMLFEYNNLEKNSDEVTVNMIIAIVQAIGFSNSFNNPIIYAFMNENFKKSCVATLSRCLRKPSNHRGGAVETPNNPTVLFIRPLKREAFSETGGGANGGLAQGVLENGPSVSSQTSSALAGEKMTENTQLPSEHLLK
ncbi:pyroglutamylated RF-amide peptide receptor-like isoform X2 [Oncorhynchus keta]|uniref:pyroglutamylated RF-amide peptide receptor-like isoform X2 n=1 Tax=Oncorhynchus keta TaxID=8018 RepID=UPI00227C24AA|nr:pyroglutamylated RF-amide peptide receptor-like isoform X2 [Oncorhynchus keta]